MRDALTSKRDRRVQRAVVRRNSYAGAVEHFCGGNFRRRRNQNPVQRKQWTVDRKSGIGWSRESAAKQLRGQSPSTPRPPFVQVSRQDRGAVIDPIQKLADGAQLSEAQALPKRQMHSDHPEAFAVPIAVGDNCASVAATRKIDQSDLFNLDRGRKKENCAKEAVAVLRPPARRFSVDILTSGCRLDALNVQQALMRTAFFVRLLKHQRVRALRPDLVSQNVDSPNRIDNPVIAAASVNVPTDAGEFRRFSHLCALGRFTFRRSFARSLGNRARALFRPMPQSFEF